MDFRTIRCGSSSKYVFFFCFFFISGLKFIVIADPRQAAVDALLKKLYEVYSDFALKNPFYSLDMPIR